MPVLMTISHWFMDRASIFAGMAALTVVGLGLAPDAGPSPDIDEYAHAGAFLVIAFLFCATIPRRPWLGVLAAIALGAGIELAQMMVPGRLGSFEDIAANLAGVVAGGLLFYAFARLLALPKDA